MSEVISLDGTDAQREAAIVEAVRSCIARLKAGSGGEGATWYELPHGFSDNDRHDAAAAALRLLRWYFANLLAGNKLVDDVFEGDDEPLTGRLALGPDVVEAACRHRRFSVIAKATDGKDGDKSYLIVLDLRKKQGTSEHTYSTIVQADAAPQPVRGLRLLLKSRGGNRALIENDHVAPEG